MEHGEVSVCVLFSVEITISLEIRQAPPDAEADVLHKKAKLRKTKGERDLGHARNHPPCSYRLTA